MGENMQQALNRVHTKTVIVIAGPTASGKTALALRMARHFGTAVISADSRQCYREMTIGTAKPSAEELADVPHYFINSHSVTEAVDAARFEKLALGWAAEVFARHDVVLLCGGTGLYIRAFCKGLDEMPDIPATLRTGIREQYRQMGLAWLQATLKERDPAFYATAEKQNPHRLLRALEVLEATGRSISTFRSGIKQKRPFAVLKLGLDLPVALLNEKIRQRTQAMIQAGLAEEVQALLPYRGLPALQTVGYREMFDYLYGHCTLDDAAKAISIHTRQYAKRQRTWFRRDPAIHWFDGTALEAAMDFVTGQLPVK